MSKKIIRIMVVILLLVLVNSFVFTNYAAFSFKQAVTDIEGKNNSTLDSKTKIIMGGAVSVVKYVAAGIAIIMLLVLAMKYMLAAPSDRAEIKKHAVVYVAGAIIMFGVSGILELIQKFTTTLGSTP